MEENVDMGKIPYYKAILPIEYIQMGQKEITTEMVFPASEGKRALSLANFSASKDFLCANII